MFLQDIYMLSKIKNVEIFIEVLNGKIIQQKIGTKTNVNGSRPTPGSDIYHTHLDNHPPSAQDLLSGLMCKALYGTRLSGVIGKNKIFCYDYKDCITENFDQFIFCNSIFGKKCDEDFKFNKWNNDLKDYIIVINNDYCKHNNDMIYILKLAEIGILMNIEEIK